MPYPTNSTNSTNSTANNSNAGRAIKARFPGTCRGCRASFDVGADVRYAQGAGTIACSACDPGLRGAAAAPASISFKARVTKIKFSGDGFAAVVAVFDHDVDPAIVNAAPVGRRDGSFTIAGPLGQVVIDDLLEVRGRWNQGKYGWEFKATSALPIVGASDQAVLAYLQRFPQVGPKRAAEILQRLGGREAVLDALQADPRRLMVAGITEERALAIGEEYQRLGDLQQSFLLLEGLDLPASIKRRALDLWEGHTAAVLRDNPYALMEVPGCGFKRADEAARKLGVGADDPRRAAAAVLHLLQEEEGGWNGGNTYTLLSEFGLSVDAFPAPAPAVED